MSFSVKATLGQDIRRFACNDTSFNGLVEQTRSLYSLDQQSDLIIRYLDEENDWIRITCDQELQAAFKYANGNLLKISVEEKAPVVVLSPPSFVPPSFTASVTTGVQASPLPEIAHLKLDAGAPHYHPRDKDEKKRLKHDFKQKKKEWKETKSEWKKDWKDAKKEWKKDHVHHGHHGHHGHRKFDQQKGDDTARLQARFIKDGNKEPLWLNGGTKFTKVWKVRNEGVTAWPVNCTLKMKKGDKLTAQDTIVLNREVLPNEEVDLPVEGVAPAEPGKYFTVWRLNDPAGRQFGQPLKMKIKVHGTSSSSSSSSGDEVNDVDSYLKDPAWSVILNQLSAMGFHNNQMNIKLIRKFKGDLDKVVWKLLKKQRKLMKREAKLKNKSKGYPAISYSDPRPVTATAPTTDLNNNNKAAPSHPMID